MERKLELRLWRMMRMIQTSTLNRSNRGSFLRGRESPQPALAIPYVGAAVAIGLRSELWKEFGLCNRRVRTMISWEPLTTSSKSGSGRSQLRRWLP